ncbi:MAG: class I SAM-dependent methyltransferase [Deltaproteobacteria bacterium]|nr:class I SAM-dependent methyltransferase [Deltaproteobacteria bacterium]
MIGLPQSPLASGGPITLVRTYPVDPIRQQWRDGLGVDLAGELAGLGELRLFRCETSGLEFFHPPEAAGSPALYEALSRHPLFYQEEKWEFRQALRDLAGRGSLLEVGAGPGRFLERVRQRLPGARLLGLEVNPWALEQARAAGFPVEAADLTEIAARGATWEAVCAFQVLEHLARPREFLTAAVACLAPGGLLLLGVPNRDSTLGRQYNILDMPPHHLTRWNAASLGWITSFLPLKLVELRQEPLAEVHLPLYLAAKAAELEARWPGAGALLRPPVQARAAAFLARSGLRRLLLGHTLYAVFQKT